MTANCTFNIYDPRDLRNPDRCVGVDFHLTEADLTDQTFDKLMEGVFRPLACQLLLAARQSFKLEDAVTEKGRRKPQSWRYAVWGNWSNRPEYWVQPLVHYDWGPADKCGDEIGPFATKDEASKAAREAADAEIERRGLPADTRIVLAIGPDGEIHRAGAAS